jgi:nucleoside-diphosphate-sugar epimerase
MRVLITGADTPLGKLAVEALGEAHKLRLCDARPHAESAAHRADLREPEEVAPLAAGMDAVLHLEPYATAPTPDADAEKRVLDRAARGTHVLLHAALKAGVRRVVLASRLELMAAYPEEIHVDETFRPLPEADAVSLAPWLAELTLREFVRAEAITGVCLRFGPLGDAPEGTTPADAAEALRRALAMDLGDRKYRWWLYHIGSTVRYPLGAASQPPFRFERHADQPAP